LVRALVLALFFGLAACSGGNTPTTLQPQETGSPEQPASGEGKAQITFFGVNPGSGSLQPFVGEIPAFSSPEKGILIMLDSYFAMKFPEHLVSPFPRGLRPRAVYFPSKGMCVLDLEFPEAEPPGMGSEEESTMVYAIVNGVSLNFSEARSVKILINGREASPFLTHLDASAFFKPRK